MSKEKVKIEGIAIKCDKCGCYYETGGEGIFYADYYDANGEQIEEEALEDGWTKEGDKHYCPECSIAKETTKHIKLL